MSPNSNVSISDEHLRDFVLGKLDDELAEQVKRFLEYFPVVWQQMAGIEADEFVRIVRQAEADAEQPAISTCQNELLEPSVISKQGTGLYRIDATEKKESPSVDPPLELDVPTELSASSEYRIIKELGRGGMGVVYLAENTEMGRLEALKVIKDLSLRDSTANKRFEQEIKSLAGLNHPNIVKAYNVLRFPASVVLAMEYVDGQDLEKLVGKIGPLAIRDACGIIRQVAKGLDHAFEQQIIHRDIKPTNLIYCKSDKTVKILDFGLAKTRVKGAERLTSTGLAMGTPHFMAPEQLLDSARVDIRADIYGLGCTFYYLLTGTTPFIGSNYVVCRAHCEQEAPLLNQVRPDVPVGLAAVVSKMLMKEPSKRYQRPREVSSAVVPYLSNKSGREVPSASKPASHHDTPSSKRILTTSVTNIADEPASTLIDDSIVEAGVFRNQPSLPKLIPFVTKAQEWTNATSSIFRGSRGSLVVAASILSFSLIGWMSWRARSVSVKLENETTASGDEPVGESASESVSGTDEQAIRTPIRASKVDSRASRTAGIEFTLIPAGEFDMGSREDERSRNDNETLHTVRITKPFFLSKHETTQSQFEQVMGYNPSHYDHRDRATHPVELVTWFDAIEFCNRLAKLDGRTPVYVLTDAETKYGGHIVSGSVTWQDGNGYRLPTEAEWEYACRSGTTTAFWVGENLIAEEATWGEESTTPVASFPANHFGLFDMHGNVREWCWDWYGQYSLNLVEDPSGPSDESRRVTRGGSWGQGTGQCRSAHRLRLAPNGRADFVGFRLAFNPSPSDERFLVRPERDTQQSTTNDKLPEMANSNIVESELPSHARWPHTQPVPDKDEPMVRTTAREITNSIGMKLVQQPGGTFKMGSPADEQDRDENERQHEVLISRPFFLGKYEVNQAEYQSVMGENPSYFGVSGEGADRISGLETRRLPVENVSWLDTVKYCNSLSRKESLPEYYRIDGEEVSIVRRDGRGYRLPTEAEWEYACRAGTTAPFFFGNSISTEQANYDGNYVYADGVKGEYRKRPMEVDRFSPNRFGLHQMHGNVSEWCWDYFADYGERSETDPHGPDSGSFRVIRGGGWRGRPVGCRSAYRTRHTPGLRSINSGFRVARAAPAPGKNEPVVRTDPNVTEPSPQLGSLVSRTTGMEFVLIPVGQFEMGSPDDESARHNDERQHSVRITNPFFLAKHEVTQSQFEQVMEYRHYEPSRFNDGNRSSLPVNLVTWFSAIEFCNRLSESDGRTPVYRLSDLKKKGDSILGATVTWQEGNGYRLPTEAEWEYACRSGTTNPFSFGQNLTIDEANYDGNFSYAGAGKGIFREKPTPIGTFQDNRWGLFDMHGNVFEWCWDWYGSYPHALVENPTGPIEGNYRVIRGGCWKYRADQCRSGVRSRYSPGAAYNVLGFRLASGGYVLPPESVTPPTPGKDEPVVRTDPNVAEPPPQLGYLVSRTTGMEFVLIPAGQFEMGSPDDEPARDDDETQHSVRISKPFYLAKHEVTQSQFERVMECNPSHFTNGDGNELPVESVTWFDAIMYCNRLSELDGRTTVYRLTDTKKVGDHIVSGTVTWLNGIGYRLPTEAEWEYVCRARTTTPFSDGQNLTTDEANYNGKNPDAGASKGVDRKRTTPVASFPPNRWGIFDMHGNVSEWCWDWYGNYPVSAAFASNPTGPTTGSIRVIRGGGWGHTAANCRSAERIRFSPDYRYFSLGFRLASGEPVVPPDSITPRSEPANGAIVLQRVPTDADVLVDGKHVSVRWDEDRTEAKIEVKPGTRNVEVKRNGITVEAQTVTISSGQEKKIVVSYGPNKGDSVVRTDSNVTDSAPRTETLVSRKTGMEFVLIPAGEFVMGSPESEPERRNDETQHPVRITKPFYLAKHEMTVGQFRQFVNGTNYETEAESARKFKQDSKFIWTNPGFLQEDNHPVVNVSWNDAQKCIEWLSRKDGREYRLPTEAEWEYACRGKRDPGTSSAYWYGDDPEGLARVGNVANSPTDVYVYTAPVGSFQSNPFGLYDMHGNVWEWCSDAYAIYPSGYVEDPTAPSGGSFRVRRGGGWSYVASEGRSAARARAVPAFRGPYLGFRVASSSSR